MEVEGSGVTSLPYLKTFQLEMVYFSGLFPTVPGVQKPPILPLAARKKKKGSTILHEVSDPRTGDSK